MAICNPNSYLSRLVQVLRAYQNCEQSGNREWAEAHWQTAMNLNAACLPSGSGINTPVKMSEWEKVPLQLTFAVEFQHMSDAGWTGWTNHDVIVTADLSGPNVRVTGRDKNGIKDYLTELFYDVFAREVSASQYEVLRAKPPVVPGINQ